MNWSLGITVYGLGSLAVCMWAAWLKPRDSELADLLDEHRAYAWLSLVIFWWYLLPELARNTVRALRGRS